MSQAEAILDTARRYFKRNPAELGRVLRSALGLRLGVPLDAVRWLAAQAEESGKAEDIVIEAVPPGFRVEATIDLMHTPVRAGAVVYIERVRINGRELRVEIRLEQVKLALAGESDSAVAMLIKSGALDLTNPGNLVKHMPKLPPFLIEARDKRIVLDFMQHPKIAESPLALHAISLLTSWVTLHGVETDESHIDVSFRALPEGVRHAARAVRTHLVSPTVRRALFFLPGAR